MKMKYVKPVANFTEFVSNEAITACDVTKYGEAVTVQCVMTQSETVYTANNTDCKYTATSLIYFAGGETDNLPGFTQDGQDGKFDNDYSSGRDELEAGYYLFWTGNGLPHGGKVPDTTFSNIKNHS